MILTGLFRDFSYWIFITFFITYLIFEIHWSKKIRLVCIIILLLPFVANKIVHSKTNEVQIKNYYSIYKKDFDNFYPELIPKHSKSYEQIRKSKKLERPITRCASLRFGSSDSQTKALDAAQAPTLDDAALKAPRLGTALEAFQPSEAISADNAVPFPINI